MKTQLPFAALAGLALTTASASAATFALTQYNSYDNPAQGAATISPFSTIFGAISEQDVTVESGFSLDIPSYDFRGLSATVPAAGQTYFFLEDIQDGQFDVPGATLTSSQVRTNNGRNGSTNSGGNADSIDEDDGSVDGSVGNPRGGIRFGTRVDFSIGVLGQLPNHVGYALAGDSPTVSITAFNSSDVQLGTVTATADVRAAFVGLTTTEGISYVTLTGTETDHFQYGYLAVPEPSTTALLGLGGLALILRRRK